MDLLIHKLSITDETKFDYETSISPNFDFIAKEVKEEVEFYIQRSKKLWYKQYFRIKYLDEISDDMLMFFIRRGKQIGSMQLWNIVGVCLYNDWSIDLEEEGMIKTWLDSSITPLENEQDWVEVLREKKAEEERQQKIDEEGQIKYERLLGK